LAASTSTYTQHLARLSQLESDLHSAKGEIESLKAAGAQAEKVMSERDQSRE